MASLDIAHSQPPTGPSVEDEPDTLQSPTFPLCRTKSPESQRTKSLKSKRSLRPVPPQDQISDPPSTLTPIQRFRMSVRKVMRLSKTSSYISGKGPGAEPGIDVRKDSVRSTYGHIRQSCMIEIADYSSVRSSFGKMTNREFISFLDDPAASEREHWVKVRWINVGGISWDVVRALAFKYGAFNSHPFAHATFTIRRADLHPLSLEDLLLVPGRPRSGANYYKRHLFIRVLSHTLNKGGDEEPNLLEQSVRPSSPEPFELEDKVDRTLPKYSADDTPCSSGFISKLSNRWKSPHKSGTIEPGGYDVENVDVTKPPTYADHGSLYATYVCLFPIFPLPRVVIIFFQGQGYEINKTVLKLMQELKDGGRVNVAIKPVCIFLFKDGGCNRDHVRHCSLTPLSIGRYRNLDSPRQRPQVHRTHSAEVNSKRHGFEVYG